MYLSSKCGIVQTVRDEIDNFQITHVTHGQFAWYRLSGRGRARWAKARIQERLAAWQASPITTLMIGVYTIDDLRTMAELVL